MASAKEVETLKGYIKQLQTSVVARKFEEAANVLRSLKKVAVSEELLRATKAGVAVSKIRTCDDSTVSSLSKEVVSRWKAEVEEAKKKRGVPPKVSTSNGASPSPAATTPRASEAPLAPVKPAVKVATMMPPKASSSSVKSPAVKSPAMAPSPQQERKMSTDGYKFDPNAPAEPRSKTKDGIKVLTLNDNVRDKCVEMVYDSIVFDSGAPSELVLSRAHAIEKNCFNEFGNTSNDYRSKIRRLVLNLKDKHNPSMRQAIVSGDVEVERFCKMTNQEMQSEERKQANDLLQAQNFHNSLAAAEQEAETDAFQCGRCKQRKTRYRQAQTRSADEPMTTFVTCTYCGNRWKFS